MHGYAFNNQYLTLIFFNNLKRESYIMKILLQDKISFDPAKPTTNNFINNNNNQDKNKTRNLTQNVLLLLLLLHKASTTTFPFFSTLRVLYTMSSCKSSLSQHYCGLSGIIRLCVAVAAVQCVSDTELYTPLRTHIQ